MDPPPGDPPGTPPAEGPVDGDGLALSEPRLEPEFVFLVGEKGQALGDPTAEGDPRRRAEGGGV